MRSFVLAVSAALGLLLAAPPSGYAQAPGAQPSAPAGKRARATRPKREPTAGQLARQERQKKCGMEWKEARAAGTTGGLKWPQFWSKCNTRLKGGTA